MSEADDAPEMAQPAPNPDAQTTVNDFLDYTEFFPSDLSRSLTLIRDLDFSYKEHVQKVHELTALYGKLPTLPEHERPDPVALRKQIAQHLRNAGNKREFSYTEASRLYESDSSGDSDAASAIHVASPRKRKDRDRHSRPAGGRSRAAGVLGTNVHSSIAGISTSNALAQLAPPPADARPGSKWAPWKKLTEYEMAVLRKQMKKNAVWTPSQTMMIRELEKKHRTEADYEREKARCEATGEPFLDEEPETLQQIMTASGLGHESIEEDTKEESGTFSIRVKPIAAKEGRKLDRTSQRQKAMQDAQELIGASEKIKEAAKGLQGLSFNSTVASPPSQKKRPTARPSQKRKRDTSPPPNLDGAADGMREASVATQDSATRPPEPKRARPNPIALALNAVSSPIPTPTSAVSTPRDPPASAALSPVVNTPVPLPETAKPATNETTVQVPLAPAGPSTPKASKATPKEPSPERSPELSPELTPITTSPELPENSPVVPEAPPSPVSAPVSAPVVTTAAATRPRRESIVPKAPSPPVAPMQPANVFSQPISALTVPPQPAPTRSSSRRKPPPKGEVTAAEDGQKTVTNVKRAQGSKNKKKKRAEEVEEVADDIDPNEPKYCICDDVSYGPMISCDNHCDKEWFHLPCMNMTEEDIPSRRAKWYCPDCRAALGTDAYGNPLVPPPLPGRRGNR
ncbi:TNG2, Chromatin remodeling protein, contains PhD zinc finger [Pyrenophora tritici-repentis]|nr:TNG2, Chromatin remodeling protein, contains PhD zinc finger [Pyrenophora tritici-repentis]